MLDVEGFDRGYEDAESGVKVGDNPFPEESEEHWEWLHGWTAYQMNQIKD